MAGRIILKLTIFDGCSDKPLDTKKWSSIEEGMTPEIAPKKEETSLNQWLVDVEKKQKINLVFELEMWIKCFDRFFRAKNQPLSEAEISSFLLKNFKDELSIVRDVTLRMSILANEIMSQERSNLLQFDKYIQNYLKRDYVMDSFLTRLLVQPTPDDSLALLLEFLSDLRTVIDDLLKLPEVSFQTFTAMGKLINREIKHCRYIEMLVAYKFKVQYDRVDNSAITALIRTIPHEGVRQDIAKVFLELFRLLRYLRFIEHDLTNDRPLKNSLLIFSLINSELQILFDFIESRICKHPSIKPDAIEQLDLAIFALSQEVKKVFCFELVGLVYLRQAPPIYAKVENSHGMLKNAIQHSIVEISRAINPEFESHRIFNNYAARRQESKTLLKDIGFLLKEITSVEETADLELMPDLIRAFGEFRDHSLKFCMYRDWESFENMTEEITASKTRDSLRFALHRFRIFLQALINEVGKRAVLNESDP